MRHVHVCMLKACVVFTTDLLSFAPYSSLPYMRYNIGSQEQCMNELVGVKYFTVAMLYMNDLVVHYQVGLIWSTRTSYGIAPVIIELMS